MTTLSVSRPLVSSPLADPSSSKAPSQKFIPRRNPSFPPSRALRPFPAIAAAFQSSTASSPSHKPIKLIQPPENHQATFLLDLTPAELARQA